MTNWHEFSLKFPNAKISQYDEHKNKLINKTSVLPLLQLLAGANVNALTKNAETALHLAAERDHASICSVLIENGVDFDALDTNQKNGLFHCFMVQ